MSIQRFALLIAGIYGSDFPLDQLNNGVRSAPPLVRARFEQWLVALSQPLEVTAVIVFLRAARGTRGR